jgi:hypothetical protein
MPKLSEVRIEALARRSGVKTRAAESFLICLGHYKNAHEAIQDFYKDAAVYKWNKDTRKAIRIGIEEHFAA